MTIGKVAIGLIIALVISPLIVYLALPSYSTAAASIPVVNNLVVVADEVYVTRAGEESQVATKQTTLEQGDSIRTSATGRALVNFFDGSSTQLEPDTIITVDELGLTKAGSTTIQFTQQVGKTWSRVAKLVDTKSSFNIQTAAAMAVIRGTLIAIDVQVDDDNIQVTEVKVFEGLSDVVANGKTVEVASGTQTTVDEGQPPDEPIVIPPPPSELDINVASPVWLHVADPLERNAGIVPPGFDTNEIPYSTNSGTLGEAQNVNITEPLTGTYYVMMHSRGDGPVTLSVDSFNDGAPFDQKTYTTFDVVSGGTYYVTVELDVDASGYITLFDASNVYLPPQSDFTTDKTTDGKASTIVNDAIQFTGNYGEGHYTSCLWDFGDGNTSDLCNPSYAYTVPGVYTVSHVVDNPVARQTSTKTDYVTVFQAPRAEFTSNYTEVVAGDSVTFSDASIGSPTVWNWNFGDGGTSTDQNPLHVYATPGTYTVTLEASNLAGADTEAKTGHVKVYAPIVAGLTADPTSAIVNVPVQFTDSSVGVARTWAWNFGDGDTSSAQNPTHAYTSTGIYTVTLGVTNPLDSDTVIETDYITVYPQPVAAFTTDATYVPVGTTVSFTDQSSSDVTAWAWDFGDQGTSILQSPLHTYTVPGVYNVLLTATNPGASDDLLKTGYISVYDVPVADFTANHTQVAVGQAVQFTDQTTGVPATWQWEFGDQLGSEDQNPVHAYDLPGTYTVFLLVTNPSGEGFIDKEEYIEVYAPVTVEITSPVDEARFETRTISVRGTVNDPTIDTVTITVNGNAITASATSGVFDQQINILEGENTITVEASNPLYSGNDSVTVFGDIPQVDIMVELTWDTGFDPSYENNEDDIDGHLIWPQSEDYWTYFLLRNAEFLYYDCYYGSSSVDEYTGEITRTPDWDGSQDISSGDPVLDTDDMDGYGPEYITLEDVAEAGRYWYFVHFYGDDGEGEDSIMNGSTATVKIWINGQLVNTFSRHMDDNYIWECAYIDWANGTGTVTAGPEDAYYDRDYMDEYHNDGDGEDWIPTRE